MDCGNSFLNWSLSHNLSSISHHANLNTFLLCLQPFNNFSSAEQDKIQSPQIMVFKAFHYHISPVSSFSISHLLCHSNTMCPPPLPLPSLQSILYLYMLLLMKLPALRLPKLSGIACFKKLSLIIYFRMMACIFHCNCSFWGACFSYRHQKFDLV